MNPTTYFPKHLIPSENIKSQNIKYIILISTDV